MVYKFELTESAQKDIKGLPHVVAKRLMRKILWFGKQNDPLRFSVQLKNPAIGDIRFRVGEYRIIAFLYPTERKVSIAAIGHRRDIYR